MREAIAILAAAFWFTLLMGATFIVAPIIPMIIFGIILGGVILAILVLCVVYELDRPNRSEWDSEGRPRKPD